MGYGLPVGKMSEGERMTVWIHEDGREVVVKAEHVEMWNSVVLTIDGATVSGHRAGTKIGPSKVKHDLNIISNTLQVLGFTKEVDA